MVHRCLQDKVPEYLKKKFVKRKEVSGEKTRSSANLNLPLCRLINGQAGKDPLLFVEQKF